MGVPAASRSKRLLLDSTVICSHPHSAGGPGTNVMRWQGRSRGGVATKVHRAAGDEKTLLATVLTPGQAGDTPPVPAVMNELPEETTADIVDADGAFDSDAPRDDWEQAGFPVNIPARKGRKQPRARP